MKNPIPWLRKIAFWEGVSYLVLLGIAMPLKYFANLPKAVLVVGSLHGALFVLLCAWLAFTMLRARWPLVRGAVLFVASLLPFGTFVVDPRLAAWEREFETGGPVPGSTT